MSLRGQLNSGLKSAMKNREEEGGQKRISTLRLILTAIKEQDIAAKTRDATNDSGIEETEILALLQKMVKQRHESAAMYDENGREQAAADERTEIGIIEEFLPQGLNDEELDAAIEAACASCEAQSMKDMGQVMGFLRENYPGQIDAKAASARVRARLSGN